MRKNKKVLYVLALIGLMIVFLELFSRFYLGLGTPPLSVAHPTIEYMFKPNQAVERFGNSILINQYGMRTQPFDNKPSEIPKVMVFGDSILNGGNLTDHSSLATTILQNELTRKTGKNIIVGNISAGSWGPGNWLAYVKEFGFFNAEAIVLVVSSHDYADNPTFKELNPNTHPTKRPFSAITEGITRYLPRYLPKFGNKESLKEADHFSQPSKEEEIKGLSDLKEFLSLAKKQTENILVLQHWEREELEAKEAKIGNRKIKQLCDSSNIHSVQLNTYLETSLQKKKDPYRDNSHLSDIGQQVLAEAMMDNLPGEMFDRIR